MKKVVIIIISALVVLVVGSSWGGDLFVSRKMRQEQIRAAENKLLLNPITRPYYNKNLLENIEIISHEAKDVDHEVYITCHIQNHNEKELMAITVTCYFLDKNKRPFKEVSWTSFNIKPNYTEDIIMTERKENLLIWNGEYIIKVTDCY